MQKREVPIWNKAPFLRLLIPLVIGFFLADHFPNVAKWHWLVFTTIVCTLLLIQFSFIHLHYNIRWITGLLISALLITLGMILFKQNQIRNKSGWFGNYLHQNIALIGQPAAIPAQGNKTARIIFIIKERIDSTYSKIPTQGKVNIYIPRESQSEFLPGDTWIINSAKIKRIRSTGNPGSFDYANYCTRQNIFHQVSLQKGDYFLYQRSSPFNLDKLLAQSQLHAIKTIRKNITQNSQGLTMALLIGYRDEVSKDLLRAYSNTGVVHVIAVSGMHLALIFFLLQRLLFINQKSYSTLQWIKSIFVLLTIWWFSGIAGAAGSIIRAAFMFTITMLAKLIRKPIDVIQSICLTAFVLLCYNPNWLWDAGFLLSFSALLSIVVYQPIIEPSLHFQNKILQTTWQLTAVTIAAQVLTLPLSIGLFHQAPIYFLAANLVAVPLSSIALITSIITWLLEIIHINFLIPAYLAGRLVEWMNLIVTHLSKLPGAIIDQLEWGTNQIILAYLIVIALFYWWKNKLRKSLVITLCCLLLFAISRFLEFYQKSRQQIFLVYHLPGKSAIEFINGFQTLRLASSAKINPTIFRDAERVMRIQSAGNLNGNLFRFGRRLIFHPASKFQLENFLQFHTRVGSLHGQPELLVIISGSVKSIAPLLKYRSRYRVIIDGSVSEKKAGLWTEEMTRTGLSAYNTWESGAFVQSLDFSP